MTIVLTVLVAAIGLPALAAALCALFTLFSARKVAALLPPKGQFVDVPGARLHLRDTGGPGPAILMIHGLGGQLAHFTYAVAGRLSGRFRVVAVDRPGCGWSTRTGGADLPAQAAALAALIDRLGLERPLVVGHSLGGAVALALALDHPDKVGGLALLAPLTHIQEQVPPVFKGLTIVSPGLRKLVAWTLAIPASVAGSTKTLAQVFGPEAVPKDFATRGGGLLALRPSAFLAASADLQALPASLPAQEARYGQLRLPLGILYGRDDRILDWRANGQALAAKVDGARFELIEGGHMLPITNPPACADFIAAMAQLVCTDMGRGIGMGGEDQQAAGGAR
jgi:pimeloyl-ACP methyl ester carboxylesterase